MRIADTFTELKTKFTVVDFDPAVISRLRAKKTPFYFGDVADVEFLESIPIANSKIIVMTIPAVDDQINLIKHARKSNPKVLVIGNAYQQLEAEELYAHGANFVMMPHFLGGHWMAKILKNKKWTRQTLAQLKIDQDGLTSV
jgi:voltage-gated potassium channel Kch